jgi:ABC-type transport system involved in multi-copper enzyme maturation permease subunit
MNKILPVGIAFGSAFILLGVFARNPGQIAISNAIIATGTAIVLAAIVLSVLILVKNKRENGS